MPGFIDRTGQRYGQLVAVEYVGRRWRCVCDCGGEILSPAGHLSSGNTRSCGCRKRAVLGESTTKHGYAGSPTYRIWKAMHTRCRNPKSIGYHNYGGRGITVCERWLKFENFLADMGERPAGLTLDRKDNDKGYCPDNCRWATKQEQLANRRTTLAINGVPLAQWAKDNGVSYSTAHSRLKRGQLPQKE